MIEVKTITDYKNLLDDMQGEYPADNFISNFLHAFNNINVGCSCKKKARIASANKRKEESIQNLSEDFKNLALLKFNETIVFYNDNEIILTITNE